MGFLKWADICTLIKIWQRQNAVSISCIKKVLMWVTIRGIFLMWLPTKPQTVAVAAESAWDSQTRSNTCTFLCRNKQPCEVPLLSMLVNDDVIYRSACKGALQEAWCSLLWLSYSVCSHQTSSMVRSIPLLTGYHHTRIAIFIESCSPHILMKVPKTNVSVHWSFELVEEFKRFIVDINMTCAVTYPYAICVLVSSGCAVVLLTFNVSFFSSHTIFSRGFSFCPRCHK